MTSQLPDAGAAELNCVQLIGTDGAMTGALPVADGGVGLALNTSYWDIGTLPKGQLQSSTCADAGVPATPASTTLAIVTGCGVGAPNAAYNCPGSTTGKLGLIVKTLDRTTALTAGDGGTIGAQFAYASWPFSSFSSLPNVGGATSVAGFFTTSFVPAPVPDAGDTDGGDAATSDAAIDAAPQFIQVVKTSLVAGPVNYGELKPTTLVPVSGVTFDGTSGFFVNAISADGGPTPLQVPIPLPTIHDLSWGPGADDCPVPERQRIRVPSPRRPQPGGTRSSWAPMAVRPPRTAARSTRSRSTFSASRRIRPSPRTDALRELESRTQ